MFETLTNEMFLSLATTGVSILAMAGTVVALRATQRAPHHANMDEIVRNAPYHRLHNLVPVKGH